MNNVIDIRLRLKYLPGVEVYDDSTSTVEYYISKPYKDALRRLYDSESKLNLPIVLEQDKNYESENYGLDHIIGMANYIDFNTYIVGLSIFKDKVKDFLSYYESLDINSNCVWFNMRSKYFERKCEDLIVINQSMVRLNCKLRYVNSIISAYIK